LLELEAQLLAFISDTYSLIGWTGVVVLMAIESACIPFPSEIIMPLSGWMLVRDKGLDVSYTLLAAFYGALGSTLGSALAYWAGIRGGRPLLERYGRYLLISHHDLAVADRWFERYGDWAVFLSRMMPVVRTFISLPAGIARTPFLKFLALTFLGSFPWCLGLAFAGYLLGEHWEEIRTIMRPFDLPILVGFLILMALYIYRHMKRALPSPGGVPDRDA